MMLSQIDYNVNKVLYCASLTGLDRVLIVTEKEVLEARVARVKAICMAYHKSR